MRNRIAITGYMEVGKTTAANFLVDELDFWRLSFSDPIKIAAYMLGWDGKKDEKGRTIMLQGLGDLARSYDEKCFISILSNRIFNPGDMLFKDNIRKVLHPNSGSDLKTEDGFMANKIVVDDMRLPLEAESLRNNGFYIVKITRDSKDRNEVKHSHSTENGVCQIEPDIELYNNGSIAELKDMIMEVVTS